MLWSDMLGEIFNLPSIFHHLIKAVQDSEYSPHYWKGWKGDENSLLARCQRTGKKDSLYPVPELEREMVALCVRTTTREQNDAFSFCLLKRHADNSIRNIFFVI